MPMYVWSLLLILLTLFFIVLELFIPSSGILAIMALSSLIAALYVGFLYSTTFGLVLLFLSMFLVPLFIVLMIKIWPYTPIGRRVILQQPGEDNAVNFSRGEEERRQQLLGKIGVACSKMLPSGVILVEGRTYDAISRGPPIEPGESVRVISVSANRIVVSPLSGGWTTASDEGTQGHKSADTFDIDAFEEPLT